MSDNNLPFNRTIVELKPDRSVRTAGRSTSFNRTIVELKPCQVFQSVVGGFSFNRTIVELKLNANGLRVSIRAFF